MYRKGPTILNKCVPFNPLCIKWLNIEYLNVSDLNCFVALSPFLNE